MLKNDKPDSNSKQRAQFGDYFGPDVKSDAAKRRQHVAPFSGGIAEGYVGGHFDIHLHARAVLRIDEPITGDLCIVFRCVNDRLEFHQLQGATIGIVQRDFPLIDWNQQQSAMLVDVLKFLQEPEPMRHRCIPSVIRLQGLNDCLSRTAEKGDPSQASRSEAILVSKNRERDLRRFLIRERAPILERERVRQMIEARPEIVEAITDSGGNIGWQVIKFDPNDIVAGLSVDLFKDAVRLTATPCREILFEHLEVVICPT
jgi:hypothetical protein